MNKHTDSASAKPDGAHGADDHAKDTKPATGAQNPAIKAVHASADSHSGVDHDGKNEHAKASVAQHADKAPAAAAAHDASTDTTIEMPKVELVNAPPRDAKGDDEVMSQPPAKTAVVVDIKSKWKSQVSAAKQEWNKLTEAELLKTDGNEHKLATLVQERQGVVRSDAYKQVKAFFEKQKAVAA